MKKNSLFEIFKVFLLIGTQLLGGGYVIFPILKKYIVDERDWIKEDELIDFYAASQCLPGIIAVNISIFSGYRAGGLFGAIFAIIGLILPAFLCIILLANILTSIVDYSIVKNAFWGIKISVIILILVTIKEMWAKSVNSKFTYLLFAIILLSFLCFSISPSIIIILAAITSYIFFKIKGENNA